MSVLGIWYQKSVQQQYCDIVNHLPLNSIFKGQMKKRILCELTNE